MMDTLKYKKASFILCYVLAALCLIACEETPQYDPLSKHATLLAFGDSLTTGVGVDPEHSYPSVLSEITGLNVINAGISGETTAEGLKRFANVIDEHQPDLVILIEGGNDILRNKDLDETKANLARMIEIAHDAHIQVILAAIPEKKLLMGASPIYSELAEEYGVALIKDIIPKLLRSAEMKSDSIHFNRKGYRRLAQAVDTKLREIGAISD